MKRILFLGIFAFFCVDLSAQINFFRGTFDQALALAQKEKKVIFLDAYASWCGPCKAMDRNVFSNKELGNFYNENFINLKIDWESAQGEALQDKYPLQAYPTMFYIDASGQRLMTAEGHQSVTQLIGRARTVLTKKNK
ncbi:MAG: thioredoxin family protein [Bacteroidales bacterium]